MDLSIQKLSKAFNQRKIFSDLSFDIKGGTRFAITGSNGSGKSTLLRILSGGSLPSSGLITYLSGAKQIRESEVYRYVHFVAPYNTVIEELSLRELFELHQRLGLLKAYSSYTSWEERLQYPFQSDQQIRMYSSGMKQRVKLAIALLDDRPLIFLDEPGSNLDQTGKRWLYNLILGLSDKQTLVMATNDPVEAGYCSEFIHLGNEGHDLFLQNSSSGR